MKRQGACWPLPLSPCKKINQADLHAIQQELIAIFKRWGRPKTMKFDNGAPFGNPKRTFVTALCLWLRGKGIQTHFNRPRIPQDNSKVERMQGLLKSWARVSSCTDMITLSKNLELACEFQRSKYPTRTLKNRTRIEVFPGLLENQRQYQGTKFDFEAIQAFLASHTWERKVAKVGQVVIGNRRIQAGAQFARQTVFVKYDAANHQWVILSEESHEIAVHKAKFTELAIRELNAFISPKRNA